MDLGVILSEVTENHKGTGVDITDKVKDKQCHNTQTQRLSNKEVLKTRDTQDPQKRSPRLTGASRNGNLRDLIRSWLEWGRVLKEMTWKGGHFVSR